MIINKKELEHLIEPIEYKKLGKEMYSVLKIHAVQLLTWNRLDLAIKMIYLLYKEKNNKLAKKIYFEDIKSQTLGKFQEGDTEKNSFEKFINNFDITYEDIQCNGYDSSKTLIPLSYDMSIRNGAHRVASSILLNETVTTVLTESETMVADYDYFLSRSVSIRNIEFAVIKFIDYAPENCYLAFLWPSGQKNFVETKHLFKKIVYEKQVKLNSNGAYNLLYELYKHMDWIGTKEENFSGIQQKLVECFPNFDDFIVIVFQADSLEEVRQVKQQVRDINKIGFSSVHITDTKEEAQRISRLLFNINGLHFLNYSLPYKYISLYSKLDKFKEFLSLNNCNSDDIILDGSIVLSLYGIRENYDIDFLAYDELEENMLYEKHDSELKYHKVAKEDLIYNSNYYFEYYGLKFISFSQLYSMKKTRSEQKDVLDCQLMESILENNKLKRWIFSITQKFFYYKIKFRLYSREVVIKLLKRIYLYEIVRDLLKIVRIKK